MKSQKNSYAVDETVGIPKNENQNKNVSIDEQLELFTELLVDYYLNHQEDEN